MPAPGTKDSNQQNLIKYLRIPIAFSSIASEKLNSVIRPSVFVDLACSPFVVTQYLCRFVAIYRQQ